MSSPRPVGVTLVGILIVISGIFIVLGGIAGLFNSEARLGVGLVTLSLMIVIGLIYLAVAKGIFSGNNFSRLLVGLLSVISLVIGVIHLIFVSGLRWSGLVQTIFALIILGLLFSRKSTAYFTAN